MPDPGLYPRSAPRPTGSQAERQVYEALCGALPPGWYAWHSLRVRTHDGWMGEGDFVLAEPRRGLLVLEVKGGRIEQRDGHWLQNGRPMEAAPIEQALRFRGLLLDRLREHGCHPPAHGVAACCTDTAFDQPPTQDDLRDLVIGARELTYLPEALPALIERALRPPAGQGGNWIARLHELWGETWKSRLALGHRVQLGVENRIKLEREQLEVLDQLDANERILVEGPAGSGKTLVAREAALRFAAAGKRVLLLTFTEALALWLRRAMADAPTVDVAPIRRFALALLREVGEVQEPAVGSPEWEGMSLRAAELPGIEGRYDVVVIDEAQDLNDGDWLLVQELVSRGRIWAFHDPAQHYWTERTIPRELFPAHFKLRRPQRCHPAIQALADRYVGNVSDEAAIAAGVRDGVIGVLRCPTPASVPQRIGEEITRMRSEGLAPNDIAVLSLRGRAAEGSIVHHDRLGGHRVVLADDAAMAEHVVCDTFLRFKGLERPAIIVTDLDGLRGRQGGPRMHIALTRALDVVRVVGTREAIAADSLLPAER
jgi:hypothetical protein